MDILDKMEVVELKGRIILLAALLVGCSSLEIPKDTKKTEGPGCGEDKCGPSPAERPTPPTHPEVQPPSTLPPLNRQRAEDEMDAFHNKLIEDLHRDENPEEPAKHILERWGFYDKPTFGELDLERDKAYSEGISAFEEMIKDEKKLTKRDKESINAELEKFLEDDHNYQVWSAHVYKQEKQKRKKRGIPESEIHSYYDMPNPYYRGNK